MGPSATARRGRDVARIIAGAAGVAVAVAAVVVAIVLASGGSDPPGSPNAAGAADVRVGATIENVGRRPNAIAVGAGSVWASSAALDRVTRLDGDTGRVLGDSSVVGRTVVGLAATGTEVWVALARPGRIVRLDRRGALAPGALPLPRDATAIDATSDAIWVAVRGGGGVPDTVLRYDPATRRRTARFEVPERARAIAAAPDGDLGGAPRHADGGASGRCRRPRDGARAPAPARVRPRLRGGLRVGEPAHGR